MSIQPTFPSMEVQPAHSVILHRHGSWAATRFALGRSKRREASFFSKWSAADHRSEFETTEKLRLYSLDTLPGTEVCERFINFLQEQGIPYEVVP